MSAFRAGAAALALAATAALAACGSGGGASTPVGGGLLSSPQKPPSISGTALDGKTLSLAGYHGKVVVLNFYASWCAPCRAETPLLERTATKTAPQGVQFLGVLFKDSATNGASFRNGAGVTYPSLLDTAGTLLTKFKNVNASSIPQTFVFARDGKLAARYNGPITDEAGFDGVLKTLAAQQVSG